MFAVYIRVSSVGQNLAGQRAEIERWLKGNGVDESQVQWFVDATSGKDLDRLGFEKLQAAVFAGDIHTVIVWKIDRLSRNLRDGINTIVDWIERGVRLVSVTQGFDFSGAVGRMVAALLLSVGEMEREHIAERQAAGIREAKRRGVYQGRQLGSTKAKPARAAELRAKGLTVSEIAASLGVSMRTAKRYLATTV
jgi:DNA invertase Pin-like site-specific DNA recombinase